MPAKTLVLLIDDDIPLCEVLRLMLAGRGFQVEIAHDAMTGLQRAYALNPDIVLLDLMLPGMDGWQVCRRFREMSDVPIIILTAMNSTVHVVEGLNLGADDYITKPVAAEELAARIRAVIRRAGRAKVGHNDRQDCLFNQHRLVLDPDQYEVTFDGKRIDLSPTEFRLLSILVEHKGRVVPHDFLLAKVWGAEYVGDTVNLRRYISYLRRKLQTVTAAPDLIHSEWGVGYRFDY